MPLRGYGSLFPYPAHLVQLDTGYQHLLFRIIHLNYGQRFLSSAFTSARGKDSRTNTSLLSCVWCGTFAAHCVSIEALVNHLR
jgi:hypothetical protein